MMRRALGAVGVALLLALAMGCATAPRPDPRYRPTESILEAIAVLRRHVTDDTYRFPPATDFTGRNVYRASLLRIENLQRVHADALRAGTWDDVIAFAKGRALERLRAFDLAAGDYRAAAQRPGPLQHEALQSAAICDALNEAAHLEADPSEKAPLLDRDAILARFDERKALLQALRADPYVKSSHYKYIVREEIERSDTQRAEYLVHVRRVYADGDVRAVAALQQLIVDNRDSKNANAHLLSLADLYATIAREYVEDHPPEGLTFDPPHFEELVDSAARLYESVSNQDGAPEKIEASQRLEAFVAFTLRVDRDRFTP
jgi:hypothetical protein